VLNGVSLDSFQILLSYLTQRNQDGPFQFYEIREQTGKIALFDALEDAMPKDGADIFELVWDTLLGPPQPVLSSDPEAKAKHQEMARPPPHFRCGRRRSPNNQIDSREIHLDQIINHTTLPCRSVEASRICALPPRTSSCRYPNWLRQLCQCTYCATQRNAQRTRRSREIIAREGKACGDFHCGLFLSKMKRKCSSLLSRSITSR
jgi:hypothetical protein